jgi:hypothetical protein
MMTNTNLKFDKLVNDVMGVEDAALLEPFYYLHLTPAHKNQKFSFFRHLRELRLKCYRVSACHNNILRQGSSNEAIHYVL